MRVIFNVDAITAPLTGIGRYALELAHGLARHEAIEELRLYSAYRWVDDPAHALAANSTIAAIRRNVPFKTQALELYQQIRGGLFRLHTRRLRGFILHTPNYVLMPFEGPALATVHDLSWLSYPDAHPVERVRFLDRHLPKTLERADLVLTDSDFIAAEIAERFALPRAKIRAIPLGRSGGGVAGDAFDYRIIDNLVSPALGKGSSYLSFGKTLPVPNRYYSAFARWDQLALMRAGRDMREIRALVREATEPEKIARLVETLDENYGYQLYRSVSRLKEALSVEDHAEFSFKAGSISLVGGVKRAQFEGWIAPELARIEGAVDAALADADLTPAQIDRVFLTGGSSLVPAVRAIFHRRFDPSRIETGAELESIASGLALMGRERDLTRWTTRAGG